MIRTIFKFRIAAWFKVYFMDYGDKFSEDKIMNYVREIVNVQLS